MKPYQAQVERLRPILGRLPTLIGYSRSVPAGSGDKQVPIDDISGLSALEKIQQLLGRGGAAPAALELS
jgi:hypothetical protein